MVLDDIFERFAAQSPVTVMARAALEHALDPSAIDALFEEVAERQYTRTLLFSTVVDLMSTVVCNVRPAIHAAFQANAESIGVSLRAVYDKIGAGALPGHALVVLDPQAMLVADVFPCEDGHAQERSLLDQVLETIRSGEVWIADRNFCTTGFLFGIARRGGSFVIRQHGATLHIEWVGERRPCGRTETGAVFEQQVRLSDGDGETMLVRRITVELDKPTRDGDTEIHILTNLPAEVADARRIAELYRRRWTVESAFGELATCLNGEVNTLGYPKAALFAFCVALVSYNVLSVVKAALRSVHGVEAVEEVSGYYLADEIAGTHRGMMIAIPADEWVVFAGLTASALGEILKGLAARVRLSTLRKHRRGPKRPQPKRASGAKISHVSTAKLLAERKRRT
jgi:hypothetical protein